MAGVVVLLVLVPAALVLALAGGSGRQLLRPPAGPLAGLDRTARRWRTAGLLAGLVAAVASLRLLTLGLGPLLAAPLLALGVLLGTVGGELAAAAPSGAVRSAPLQVRRVRDHVPAGLAAATAAATGVLAVPGRTEPAGARV